MNISKHTSLFALGCWFVFCGSAFSQDSETDAASLAKKVQNPLATLVTLPLQANYNTGVGSYDRTMFNLNVQPVIPFPGKKVNVIARTIIPVNSMPRGEEDSTFGLGDANLTLFFSPAESSSVTWGVRPMTTLSIAVK